MSATGGFVRTGLCATVLLIAGCFSDVKDTLDGLGDLGDLRDAGIDLDEAQDEALQVLRKLFPHLSTGELLEIKAELSLDEIRALRDELQAIRRRAKELSDALVITASERVARREQDLADLNEGYPERATPVGRVCAVDTQAVQGRVQLTGVFDGQSAVLLEPSQVSLTVNGEARAFETSCAHQGASVDIVFLVDITGSMREVIHAVRDSVVAFVDALEAAGVAGTVSVVTFQDSVGVDVTFQQPAPADGHERSPFFEPVSLSDASGIQALRDWVNRLEASRGADLPENLAGALDFAHNGIIGYAADGSPNIIGEGDDDPTQTRPFPDLPSDRQVFVAFTDATFHADDRDPTNSSLRAPFVPRDAPEILASLLGAGAVVHVVDPSWVDESTDPAEGRSHLDADYWAVQTGGVGEDRVAGYSLVDLELVVVAESSGLLDITLDRVVASSCTLTFTGEVPADAEVALALEVDGSISFEQTLPVVRH